MLEKILLVGVFIMTTLSANANELEEPVVSSKLSAMQESADTYAPGCDDSYRGVYPPHYPSTALSTSISKTRPHKTLRSFVSNSKGLLRLHKGSQRSKPLLLGLQRQHMSRTFQTTPLHENKRP